MKPSKQRLEIPQTGNVVLRNARVPSVLLTTEIVKGSEQNYQGNDEALAQLDIEIHAGKITRLTPAGYGSVSGSEETVDLADAQVWPCYVDIHTHLDKTLSADRTVNRDRSLLGAIEADKLDQDNYWSVSDLTKRMDFALQCAYHHGTAALRTHLISNERQRRKTWTAFSEIKQQWSPKIDLQAASLVAIDDLQGEDGKELADFTLANEGILGCAIINKPTDDKPADNTIDNGQADLDAKLLNVFNLAGERQLDLDFHVDENLNPDSHALRHIAKTAMQTNFKGKVVVGHCCSLAVQSEKEVNQTLSMVQDSGISLISLPTTNLYLQDRNPGTTPQYRGLTRVHEIRERGISLAIASDNCRDQFNLYGDYDMHEIFSQAVKLGHLDLDIHHWPDSVTSLPAQMMGLKSRGKLAVGCVADLIIFSGRSYSELLSRPESNRIVLRAGKPILSDLPDYRLLDHPVD